MIPNQYRPARPEDLKVGTRVFCHYVGDPTTPTADSLGTVVELRDDGWHAVRVDTGRLYSFNHERLAVFVDELEELEQYHAAALAHLETVNPRPMHQMTERDAEPYHEYGDTPAEAAELWAESTLYEIEHDDEWPAELARPDLFHLPETIDDDGVWQQDAQHGPYVAESTPDGTTARVVHIPSPYSTERRTVEVFLADDAWQQAMATAWRYYRNERPTYAGGR